MKSIAISLLWALAQDGPTFHAAGWVNVKELSLERLQGKIVALYFFEMG